MNHLRWIGRNFAVIGFACALAQGGSAQQPASQQTSVVYDLCARGFNDSPHSPFIQTTRVKLTIGGAPLDAVLLRDVQTQLIRNLLWLNRASEVFIENYDEEECSARGGAETEIVVNLSADDIDQLRTELGRGPTLFSQLIAKVANQAVMRMDQASSVNESQKQWLRVFYATNRNSTGKWATAEAFSTKRVDAISYGQVEVSVLRQKNMDGLVSPAVFKFEAATSLSEFATAGELMPLTREQWLQDLKSRASRFQRPGTLLFVHGYNVSFVDAARRAAQLSYDLAFPGPTVFFSWPSDGLAIAYLRDGRDAENSWVSAASVMADLTSLLPKGPVYIVAHSMGNRVMLGGLKVLFDQSAARREAIREVVMAAPDIDQATFRLNYAPKLLNLGPRFTLYASSYDLALGSAELLHGGNRLGMGGQSLFATNGVDSIDASAIKKPFFGLNHSYFGDNTEVLSDIFFLVRQRLSADKRPRLQRLGVTPSTTWTLQ
jgi:esterase/lipase superfamily enzyme